MTLHGKQPGSEDLLLHSFHLNDYSRRWKPPIQMFVAYSMTQGSVLEAEIPTELETTVLCDKR